MPSLQPIKHPTNNLTELREISVTQLGLPNKVKIALTLIILNKPGLKVNLQLLITKITYPLKINPSTMFNPISRLHHHQLRHHAKGMYGLVDS